MGGIKSGAGQVASDLLIGLPIIQVGVIPSGHDRGARAIPVLPVAGAQHSLGGHLSLFQVIVIARVASGQFRGAGIVPRMHVQPRLHQLNVVGIVEVEVWIIAWPIHPAHAGGRRRRYQGCRVSGRRRS